MNGQAQPTHILQIIEANPIGGAQKIADQICSSLEPGQFKSFFLLIDKQNTGHHLLLQNKGYPSVMVPFYLIRRMPSHRLVRAIEPLILSLALVFAILKFRISLGHVHVSQFIYLSPLFSVLGFYRIPFVWTIHGLTDYPLPTVKRVTTTLKQILATGQRIQVTQVAPNTNCLLVDEFKAEDIPVTTILNGIALDQYSFSDSARKNVRQQLRIPQDTLLIGSVGRLEYEKGFDILIRAFHDAANNIEGVSLVIIGEGSLRSKLNELVSTLGLTDKVFLLGAKEHIVEWLSALDIYVQPSRMETFVLTLLEAMSVGLPVIATNVGGIPFMLDDGKAGILVSPESPEDLSTAIIQLCADTKYRDQIAGQAHERVQAFSVLKMLEAYQNVYANLLQMTGN